MNVRKRKAVKRMEIVPCMLFAKEQSISMCLRALGWLFNRAISQRRGYIRDLPSLQAMCLW